jgi:8-oxo-dGTP pyrophosphatase MutT (NUDIX family)
VPAMGDHIITIRLLQQQPKPASQRNTTLPESQDYRRMRCCHPGLIRTMYLCLAALSTRRPIVRAFTAAPTRKNSVVSFLSSRAAWPSTSATRAAAASTSTATHTIGRPDDAQLLQDALSRIQQVNNMPTDVQNSLWLDFCLDGKVLGRVCPAVANLWCEASQDQVFVQDVLVAADEEEDDSQSSSSSGHRARRPILTLHRDIRPTVQARSEAVAQVTQTLRDQGTITGWRDELFPVVTSFHDAPAFLLERAAVPWLGVLEYGVHINGIVTETVVQDDDSDNDSPTPPRERMWMARRSATKSKYPGMVDHIVAGGQPAGLSLWENALKECQEEAGIPASVAAAGLTATGAVSYESYSTATETLSRVVLFNYDLQLPADFVPQPVDGEVQDFFLWDIDQLRASFALDFADPLKPNCYLPVMDWMLRKGYISPDAPGYLEVLRTLRSGDCR